MANQQITSALSDLAGGIVRALIASRLRPQLSDTRPAASDTGGDSPPTSQEGCPYCAAARALAVSHLYLTRATEQPQMSRIYQRLAQLELIEATKILLQVNLTPPTESLQRHVTDIETTLRLPADRERLSQAADKLWECSSQALALAEGIEGNSPDSPCFPGEIEEGIVQMESKITELEGSYP